MTAIVIKATTKWNKSKQNLLFDQQKILFEEYSEANVKQQNQMCAPLLCLFAGCNLMVTKNKEVLDRITNGTTCIFKKIILKPESKLEIIQMLGCLVNAISIEFVDHIVVEWQDCEHFVGRFQLKPGIGTFRVKYPISEFGLHTQTHTNIEWYIFLLL